MDPAQSRARRVGLVRARALAAALIYAALATIWIVSSDLLVSAALQEPSSLTWANTAKGIAFVLVTTAALFLMLLHFGRLGHGDERLGEDRAADVRTRWIVVGLLVVFSTIGGLGLKSLVSHGREAGIERLDLLAGAVAAQVGEWREARVEQLKLLARAQPFHRLSRDGLISGDPRSESQARARLSALRETTGAAAVLLLNDQGQPLLSSGKPVEVGRVLDEQRREALKSGVVEETGFYRVGGVTYEGVYLDLVIDMNGEGALAGATMVLRLGPESLRLPGLMSWSTNGGELRIWLVSLGRGLVLESGEAADGNGVLASRDARPIQAALSQQTRLDDDGLPVHQWQSAEGVAFLGVSRPVPGMDLRVVAAFDERRWLDAIGDELLWAGMVLLMALLGGLSALGLWQMQRRAATAEAQTQARAQIDAERVRRLAIAERYTDLVENARDIFLVFDDEGRVIEANQAAEGAYGLDRETLLTRSITDLRAPQTLDSLEDEWQSADDRHGVLFQTWHRRADGSTFPVEVSSRRVEIDGRSCRQSIIRDISERKATQRRLDANERLLAIAGRIMRFGGWTVDLETYESAWSDEVCRIHGMPKGTRIPAEEGINFYAPESRERIRAVFTACAREGVPYDEELQIIDAQGVRHWVRTTGEAVRDDQGRIVAVQGAFQDVSQAHEARIRLEQSEQALREREEQLQLLIEHSPAALAMFDRQMNYLATSRRWRENYGRGDQEQVGVNHYSVFPDIGDARRWAHQQALAGEVVRAEEDRIDWPDGRSQWLNWETRPWYGSDGEVGGVIIFSLDVTEQHLAREKLALQARRSEALLALPRWAERMDERAFMQQALEVAEDLTGSEISFVHFVNGDEETIELVTWSRRTLETYCDVVHDSHYPISEAGIWADALRSREPVVVNDYPGYPDKNDLPEGHARLSRMVSVPVVEHGRVVMLAGVGNKAVDYDDLDTETIQLIAEQVWRIVQRQRSEAHLRQLSVAVEQSPESVVITDLEPRILYVNEAFVRVTGYTPEEVIGKNPSILQSGRTPESHYEQMWRCLTEGRPWKGEFYNRRKDGTDFVEFGHVAPLRQPDGQISHYVAVKDDITEKKRLAEELDRHRHHLEALVEERTGQLEEARARADAANQAKSAFLANMSHEIRTPLNAIVGLIYLLREACKDEPQRRKLTQIDKAARHLLAIINDILDLSKIEAGKLQLDTRDFHLSAVLDHLRSVLAEAVRAKGLTLDIDPDAVPQWLHGDPTRLRQALLNLVGNAVKFTEKGGVEVRARVLDSDEKHIHVRFEVQDSGVGIPEERLGRLFRPFEQADSSTTREYGGTGLGLAITRRLVELMGGTIGVTSQPGAGSLFWIEVPLAPGEGSPPELDSDALAEHFDPSSFERFGGARVLLAEDNAVNREVAAELIGAVGLQFDTAEDGQIALELAQDHRYDLVLLDVQMPRLDGLSVARRLRGMPGYGRVPILAMTANVFEEDRHAALEAGMNDFIPKPVEPSVLYAKMLRWLGGHPEREDGSLPARSAEVDPGMVLDEARGVATLAGNRKAYLTLLQRFLNEHRTDPERLLGLFAHGDNQAAEALSHALKGAAANLGAGEVADLASRIQHDAADHPASETLKARCRDLDEAMDRLATQIEALVEAEPASTADDAGPRSDDQTAPADDALLEQLKTALADDDVEAVALIERHEQALIARLGHRQFSEMARCASDFDFPRALAVLAEAMDS